MRDRRTAVVFCCQSHRALAIGRLIPRESRAPANHAPPVPTTPAPAYFNYSPLPPCFFSLPTAFTYPHASPLPRALGLLDTAVAFLIVVMDWAFDRRDFAA